MKYSADSNSAIILPGGMSAFPNPHGLLADGVKNFEMSIIPARTKKLAPRF